MSLIPKQFLNAVISIELKQNIQGEEKIVPIATGFLVGKKVGENKEKQNIYKLFLVTNRHVFYNDRIKEYTNKVYLRFNTLDNKSHYFEVDLLKIDGAPLWSTHAEEKVDLAVLPISAKVLEKSKIDYFFFIEENFFFAKEFERNHISTGDGLFVLGFPRGINGRLKNFVIVRKGIIARVDEEVLDQGFYYIDAPVYPGNSGGPVISKPEVIHISGTNSNLRAGLIGVISSGETYSDTAISGQTGAIKVIFTEQMGLARVVPVEFIYEIIDTIFKPTTEEAQVKDVGLKE